MDGREIQFSQSLIFLQFCYRSILAFAIFQRNQRLFKVRLPPMPEKKNFKPLLEYSNMWNKNQLLLKNISLPYKFGSNSTICCKLQQHGLQNIVLPALYLRQQEPLCLLGQVGAPLLHWCPAFIAIPQEYFLTYFIVFLKILIRKSRTGLQKSAPSAILFSG